MLTKQEITGHWNELRGRIEQRWSQLSGNELDGIDGDVDRLVGTIQQKTGQARASIESELEKLNADLSQGASKAAEGMGEYAQQAVRDGRVQMEETIRRRPTESIAVAFGTGLIAGAVVGLMLRSR
jgi:uncharacterized protein YjbJ (UPF0337 family)